MGVMLPRINLNYHVLAPFVHQHLIFSLFDQFNFSQEDNAQSFPIAI
jgi:hypothetical protein